MQCKKILLSFFLLSAISLTVLAKQPVAWSGVGQGNSRAEELAQQSIAAKSAMQYIRKNILEIKRRSLRTQLLGFIDNPAPTYQLRAVTLEEKKAVLEELRKANLVPETTNVEGIYPPVADPKRGAQSFLAAPGSYYSASYTSAGHHSYPGGLPIHTALNLRVGLAMLRNYKLQYTNSQISPTFLLSSDVVVSAIILHDVMKTLVFQWNDDGSQFLEQQVGTTGTHHVLGLAEQFCRNFPPEVIIATASAHNPPRPGELRKKVVAYLRAAAIIARVDPIKYGVLVETDLGEYDLTLPALAEHFIVHLSDADYFYSEHAAATVVDRIRLLAEKELGWSKAETTGAKFNWLRNTFLSMSTGIAAYQVIIEKGEDRKLLPLLKIAVRKSERLYQ